VEFTGGTVMELRYPHAANQEKIRHQLEQLGFEQPEVTSFGTAQDVLLRLPVAKGDTGSAGAQKVFAALCADEGGTTRQIESTGANGQHSVKTSCFNAAGAELVGQQRVEFVGPQVGEELAQNGMNALAMVVIGVMIYLAVRFEWKFAVAAIIANLHDVVIILGFFALFQWEFSLPVLAAVLAVLGYSVNESVVIADRIRENFRKMRKASVTHVIDSAITRTLSRTIITHGSTLLMVLSIFFFGGETLHHFSLALAIGICFGIYSSALVMASLVMWLGVSREDLVKSDRKRAVAGEKILP
jgi:preprotein translocase subunit SecF